MRYHYIYKIILLKGKYQGYYYLGKHTTRDIDNLSLDHYAGSGKIVRNYYNKYGKIEGETFKKEILEFNDSRESNNSREREIIGDLYKTDKLCLNLRNGGDGGGWEPGMPAWNKGKHPTKEHLRHQSEAQNKPILQYDLEGNFIKEWKSEKSIDEYYGGKSVNKAVIGKLTSCYGYMWQKKNGEIIQKIEPYKSKRDKNICQYSKEGVFIKKWNSLAEAAKEYNVSTGAIFNAIRKRNRCKYSAGYMWKYA